ncbi:formimidoylglutamate deiminase [Hephaestia mangrovi]|uniref:formimidoylglutamate deiminase n=1 Tax=Hephaestia mangrovi TaxID=2873268 RepID=UPI001CA7872A|nr:formimidoylglutamate deiminase [Hephaestia mangrovi]MBY8827723.1 formimidoylglutamate deiminase [Hephaestia mangrovi]
MTDLWFETALLPDGWADRVRVTLDGERIAAVEANAAADAARQFGAAVPGLGNLHSHAFQRAMAGLGEVRGAGDDSFWTWREVMYRFAGAIGPEALEAIAAMAFVEMLESGFVRVGEFHYLHHRPDGRPYDDLAEMGARIGAAADATGIGLTLLPVLYMQGGFGGAATDAGQRRFVNDLDRYAALHAASARALARLPDAVVGVAPHSLRAVGPEALAAMVEIGGDGPKHIHVAEQQREVDDCLAWSGARPVAWLLDHAPVGPDWCLVHATHMSIAETRRLATSGAVAGLCPLTEASLGDGIFNGRDYVAAGGRYGIGSDSNVLIDAGQELAALEYSQRLAHRQRNVMAAGEGSTGRALFDAALAGGAQALGVAPGRIEIGAPADVVALDLAHPSCAGRQGDALLDAWVFAGQRGMVDAVWRRGRHVVRGGRHIARDAVAARYRAAVAGLAGA